MGVPPVFLSDVRLRSARRREKAYKLVDGGGLYVQVRPSGAKYWRLKYRFAGKERLLALGVYPAVRVDEARAKRDEAKRLLREKHDPGVVRRNERHAARESASNTFEAIAREWIERQQNRWTPGHTERVLDSLVADVFGEIGHRPVKEIPALCRSATGVEEDRVAGGSRDGVPSLAAVLCGLPLCRRHRALRAQPRRRFARCVEGTEARP
jgi:hypothetical protein